MVPQTPKVSNQNQIVNNKNLNTTHPTQSNPNEINVPNSVTEDQTVTIVEEKQVPKKREPPKLDMMSELKMRFANRANQVSGGNNSNTTETSSNLSNNQISVNPTIPSILPSVGLNKNPTPQVTENKRKKIIFIF